METIDKIISGAIAGVLVLSTTAYADPVPQMEKCYGIVKAQMNDCHTSHSSCAGGATKDSQPDAFLLVPQGLCDKIVGGSLKPPASDEAK
jgi:uncharacterized membrane protein